MSLDLLKQGHRIIVVSGLELKINGAVAELELNNPILT